jgi:hypoxanthine phosphoribosyltransferase
MPDALRSAGFDVEIHYDHFDQNTADVVWIVDVGRRGWVTLTADKPIRTNQVEVIALMKSDTARFVLTSNGGSGAANAMAFLHCRPVDDAISEKVREAICRKRHHGWRSQHPGATLGHDQENQFAVFVGASKFRNVGYSAREPPSTMPAFYAACEKRSGSTLKTLLSSEQIRAGVARLAGQLAVDYAGKSPAVIGVLTGSMVLLADLIRQIDLPLQVGLVQARSYRGAATRPGELEIHAELLPEISDRDVVLVDDIFDTGRTLHALVGQLGQLGPRSLRTAVLLRKLERREVPIEPDYWVFEIPNVFVVGYGLDYQDSYRHLPYVAELDEHDL